MGIHIGICFKTAKGEHLGERSSHTFWMWLYCISNHVRCKDKKTPLWRLLWILFFALEFFARSCTVFPCCYPFLRNVCENIQSFANIQDHAFKTYKCEVKFEILSFCKENQCVYFVCVFFLFFILIPQIVSCSSSSSFQRCLQNLNQQLGNDK